MTIDRAIHLLVGLLLLVVMIVKRKESLKLSDYCFLVFACSIGTWVLDWDLMLGIGFHRSPLTHSVLPWVLVYLGFKKLKLPNSILIGFAIGLSSHLLWDIVYYGDVRWIQGGNNDRLFLFANSLMLIGVAYFRTIKTYIKPKHLNGDLVPIERTPKSN